MQMARKRGWCEFEPMHFDIAGVLGPIPPSGILVTEDSEVPPSLEHQNLRVESAVPGHHALLLEHQRLSGHSDDEEEVGVGRNRGGSGTMEPLLPSVPES
jgi:hypothetical protein